MTTLETGPLQGRVRRRGAGERSGAFDALGHRFAVACDDTRIAALVEAAFADLAVCATASAGYRIRRGPGHYDVRWNDSTIGTPIECVDAVALMRSHVQRSAIAAAEPELVLRAGCVEADGRALVLSGAAGSGVSTLLAALVAEGCTYLSDDTVAVEQQSGRVRPFPQPLMLDDRSLEMVPVITALRSGPSRANRKRLVAFPRRAPLDATPRDVSVVVFQGRADSRVTTLQPVTFDDAVIRLAECAYNFPGHEVEAIEAIHWLVRGATTFCVVGRDPHDAARAVLEAMADRRLVAGPSSSSGHRMCPDAGRPPV